MTPEERRALKTEIRAELIEELNVPVVCSNCKYFMQHYIKDGPYGRGTFTPINCGHCTSRRIKSRTPGTIACNDFEWKDI